MKYVALLRGINVGGKAKVEMARLKTVFENLGFDDVVTYINSGNVIFVDKNKIPDKVQLIEKAIKKEFGFAVPVIIRTQEAIKALLHNIPNSWTNDQQQRTDVLFLWDEVDDPDVMKSIAYKADIETFIYLAGAVVWNVARENVRRGSGPKLIGTELYKHMTVRNINTVRKLDELMSG